MKKRIAVYIDYVLRVPNIEGALLSFLDVLSKEISNQEEINEINFWGKELKNEEVFKHYSLLFTIAYDEERLAKINLNNLKDLFYNEEHYITFLNDSSFILFASGQRMFDEVFDYFNLMSQKFKIDLIDYQISNKQSKHTLHFLSKFFINFNRLIIAKEKLDETDYDFVFDNLIVDEKFDSSFILNKLKEIECKLTKEQEMK